MSSLQMPKVDSLILSNKDKIVSVTTDKCTKQYVIKKSVDYMFYGNIIFGGLLGSSTDYSTDKMWKYDDTIIIPCS